jgi:PAS domain S-box-containing protein
MNKKTGVAEVKPDQLQQFYYELVESSQTLMWQCDREGRFTYVNSACQRIFGYTPEEMLGQPCARFQAPEVAEQNEVRFTELMRGESPQVFETIFRAKGGQLVYAAVSATPIIDETGAVVGARATALDITARKKGELPSSGTDIAERTHSEDGRQSSERRYRSIVENITDALYIHDFSGNILDVNENACLMLGYNRGELVGGNLSKIYSPSDNAKAASRNNKLADNGSLLYEGEHVAKDGHHVSVQVSAKIVPTEEGERVYSFVRDTSEIKKSEELLRNAQKLESLGVLAGGIAHDFNNLLGGIFGLVDVAQALSKDRAVKGYLSAAMSTMNRARALTQQLLTFSAGGEPVRRVQSLFPFLRETTAFALSGSRISCNFTVADDLWSCNCDRNQIGQVIDNIVINAQQAMPTGGTITVTASNVIFTERQHPSLSAGTYVRISVSDRGVGIPRELVSRIFDPFFTTKQKGSGLGLAIGYSIIKRHGGHIDVESRSGLGTTFHVYLPAENAPISSNPPPPKPVKKGEGRVLVMEDEQFLRDTVSIMLSTLGYECVCTAEGSEAINSFVAASQTGRPFHAVILDLTIPGGMGGIDTVKAIRRMDSEIPVFVFSGYAGDAAISNPGSYGFTDSLRKPFRTSDLADLLNRHLVPNAK